MLLEALRERALQSDDVLPAGYQHQPIRYIFRIDRDGNLLGVLDTAGKENRNRGTSHPAPHVKRTVGINPKLLADTAEYVLGIARNDPQKPANPERVVRQHEAFVALVQACADTTGDATVRAVLAFLQAPMPTLDTLPEDFDPAATLTFRVVLPGSPEGVLPISVPSVQAFWASHLAPAEAGEATTGMTCIVCGNRGPVLERHPLKIKGIPGGQIQKDLISANKDAFLSYGLKASQVAPTCPACAEAYGNALNALLASKATSLWTKELAYAFWPARPDHPAGQRVVGLLAEPQAHSGEVRELLKSFYAGKEQSLSLDPARFYAAAFGASGARVVVKDWIDTTVGEALIRLARYFALQELVQWDGAESSPIPVSWIANATVHRTGTPSPIVSKSLVRLALAGGPLPMDLLYLAVKRNRAEQGVSRERAVLIKMVLGSQSQMRKEEIEQMTHLNDGNTDPAYLCGRLLATLDRIQYLALGRTNAGVVDKYYGTASSAPASVFGTLIHGAQNHLHKMQRDKPGAYTNLERQLEEIMLPLVSFPRTLTLEEQGLFALGFYHQRAADRARSSANKANQPDEIDDTAQPALEGLEG